MRSYMRVLLAIFGGYLVLIWTCAVFNTFPDAAFMVVPSAITFWISRKMRFNSLWSIGAVIACFCMIAGVAYGLCVIENDGSLPGLGYAL